MNYLYKAFPHFTVYTEPLGEVSRCIKPAINNQILNNKQALDISKQ